MQSIIITSSERKVLIQQMKRERRPSRRLRMHIVLLSAEGRSPTEIARALFCSRTLFIVSWAVSCRRGERPSMIAKGEVRRPWLTIRPSNSSKS